jgi:pimeloyl-ACP methyl ester carboxylesterase
MTNAEQSKTVMFIHGAWLTPAAWEPFRALFAARGFETVAPAWPYMEAPIEQLRASPRPELAKLTIGAIVAHYERLVRAMPEPPIVIGHSFGGLFAQILLDRGLGAAGVAIDPVPIRGVLPTPRALRSAMPVLLGWRSWERVVTMPFERFASDFAQTLPEVDRRAAYDRYIVPTPGRLYYQAALGIGTHVNVDNPHRAPLLLVAGEEDRTIEASMVRATYQKQRRSLATTELRTFPGRSHFLVVEPGWEEIAEHTAAWARRFARTAAHRAVTSAGAAPAVTEATSSNPSGAFTRPIRGT